MIHINIKDKNPPKDWCKKAESLTEELKQLKTSSERKEFINKRRIWSKLQHWLKGLSDGKCWYSEAREIYSFYDVDHFRPKNRAKQLDGTKRDGYWWLAFDWRNYRLSGNIGNRANRDEDNETRGKVDFFPVRDGSHLATGPESDLRDELFYLLDPTDPDDPPLLTFDESGYPKPAVLEKEGKWEYDRATITIKLLHLDYGPLVDERKRIWTRCTLRINQLQNLMQEQTGASSVTIKTQIKNIRNELREMISEKAELSSTARACLLSSSPIWVRNCVLNP